MATASTNLGSNQVYGAQGNPIQANFPGPVIADRDPTTTDINYKLGREWVNKTTPSLWYLGSKASGSATWIAAGSGAAGGVVTITGDSGGAESPLAGNFNLLGTANQITVAGSANTETWSLSATLVAPGSIESTTSITAGNALIVTTGGIAVNGGDIINSHSSAGADVTIEVTNSDNTNAASRAGVEVAVGGASGGDPYLSFQISGVGASTMSLGLDNSDSDKFVISNSTALGTSNALTLTQAGALAATTSITAGTSLTATLGNITATNGNLVLTAEGNKMVRTSVASTTAAGANSIGSVTLVGGTATIATTNVTASSLIRLSRLDIGATGAAALGILTVGTITAATSFVINAVQAADATALQASDVSVVLWEIIN